MAGTGRIKEGYLRKYGSVVSGWRKKYFTLYQDGRLGWTDGRGHTPDKSKAINVRTECSMPKIGVQVGSNAPSVPTGMKKDYMLSMTAKGKNYYILAETEQDMVQWLQAIYQAKGIAPPAQQQQPAGPVVAGGVLPQGQVPYPSQVPSPNHPPAYGFNPNLTGQPPRPVAASPYTQAGGSPAQQRYQPQLYQQQPYQQQPYQQQPYLQQPYQQQPYQQQPYIQQQARPAYPTQVGRPVVVTQPTPQTVIIYEQSRPPSRSGLGLFSFFSGGNHRRNRHTNHTDGYSHYGGGTDYDSGGGGGGCDDGGGGSGGDGGGDGGCD